MTRSPAALREAVATVGVSVRRGGTKAVLGILAACTILFFSFFHIYNFSLLVDVESSNRRLRRTSPPVACTYQTAPPLPAGNTTTTTTIEPATPTTFECFVDPRTLAHRLTEEDSYTVVRNIDDECALATNETLQNCRVPRVVHLVMVGGRLKFHHYLSIKSIHDKVRPELMFLHGYDFPREDELFDRAVAEFGLVPVASRTVTKIYHNPVDVFEHKSDVLRLESVTRFGGMYFDLDVFVLKDMDPFFDNEVTMGWEPGGGINNGIIVAKRCARFLRHWYHQYHTFDDRSWIGHSVQMPMTLYQEDPRGLVLASDALLNRFPSFVFDEYNQTQWGAVRAVHSFYRSYNVEHDFEDVRNLTNGFGRLARHILHDGPAMDEVGP